MSYPPRFKVSSRYTSMVLKRWRSRFLGMRYFPHSSCGHSSLRGPLAGTTTTEFRGGSQPGPWGVRTGFGPIYQSANPKACSRSHVAIQISRALAGVGSTWNRFNRSLHQCQVSSEVTPGSGSCTSATAMATKRPAWPGPSKRSCRSILRSMGLSCDGLARSRS